MLQYSSCISSSNERKKAREEENKSMDCKSTTMEIHLKRTIISAEYNTSTINTEYNTKRKSPQTSQVVKDVPYIRPVPFTAPRLLPVLPSNESIEAFSRTVILQLWCCGRAPESPRISHRWLERVKNRLFSMLSSSDCFVSGPSFAPYVGLAPGHSQLAI